jgi:autotransporter-associated beta strand protein
MMRKLGAKMAGRIVSQSAASRLDARARAARRASLSTSTSRLALAALLGAGASSLALPTLAGNVNVDSQSALASAITNASNGDVITLTGDITLTSPLPPASANVSIVAGEFRLSGAEFTKSGPGILTLTGTNTFKGASITGGILGVATEASLGSPSSDIIVNGGSVGGYPVGPTLTIDRSLLLVGNGGVDTNNSQINWSGTIEGSGQLIKSGPGTLELSGVNSYRGGTKILGGTLVVDSDAKLGKSSAPVYLGGTLKILMNDDLLDNFVSSRPIVLTGAESSVGVDAHILEPRHFTATLNGPVTGGTLNKNGPGTLILNGANNYTKTNIFAGELQGDAKSINGDVTFFAPSVLTFDLKPGTGAGDFRGSITGPGSVVKTGNVGLTLSGENTYTGGTDVQQGLLAGTTDSLQGKILNNSRVDFRQEFDGTYSGDMTGVGQLVKQGNGNVTTTGRVELGSESSGIFVSQGRLTVDGALLSQIVRVFPAPRLS